MGHWEECSVTCKSEGAKLSKKPGLLELPYYLAIPLLGTYPEDLKGGTPTDICTPTFIAASFIIAKGWKQPKCPLMDEQISKMGFIHTMGY